MIQQTQSYPETAYSSIGLDQLLTYAVDRVLARGEDCTFENIVFECFTKFPLKFGFERFPQWPDSARVNKSWLRCRTDKGWIVGNVKSGFKLTPAGKIVAGQVTRQLEGDEGVTRLASGRTRSREAAAVRYVKETPLFKSWQANRDEFTIGFPEFVALLNATLETPRRVLRQNLHFYKESAMAVSDGAVRSFLEDCESNLESKLKEP